jgi:hypothetical protein
VDLKGGVGGAGSTSIGEARCKMKVVRKISTAWIPFSKSLLCTKALLVVLPEAASCTASPSSLIGSR